MKLSNMEHIESRGEYSRINNNRDRVADENDNNYLQSSVASSIGKSDRYSAARFCSE